MFLFDSQIDCVFVKMSSSLQDKLKCFSVSVPAVPDGQYEVFVGSGYLQFLRAALQEQFAPRSPFVITDASLVKAGHWDAFRGGDDLSVFVIDPPGEVSKNMQTISAILEAMEGCLLGRDSLVIGLGGGTVGDMAGFAAAVFKRGVPVVHIPTTTVSQADSSIGGKTGVDSSQSKNAFGAFWQPAAVYMDTATLQTLDDVQYRAGLAESVKHAAIADEGFFAWLEEHTEPLLKRRTDALEHLACENCRIKASVVMEDPTEKNRRRILNYGHTIGHAVEALSGYTLLHGQAVAIGMTAAGWIEKEMGLAADDRLERIETLLKKLGLPTRIPPLYSPEQILSLLKLDKKALGRRPRFVLLEKLGKVLCQDGQWAVEVPENLIEQVLCRLTVQRS